MLLPSLVRATCINASRAIKSRLTLYQSLYPLLLMPSASVTVHCSVWMSSSEECDTKSNLWLTTQLKVCEHAFCNIFQIPTAPCFCLWLSLLNILIPTPSLDVQHHQWFVGVKSFRHVVCSSHQPMYTAECWHWSLLAGWFTYSY